MSAVGPHSTTAELEAADVELSKLLLGPMRDWQRAEVVADRKEIRAELAKRKTAK